jgi:hypothetical protein
MAEDISPKYFQNPEADSFKFAKSQKSSNASNKKNTIIATQKPMLTTDFLPNLKT